MRYLLINKILEYRMYPAFHGSLMLYLMVVILDEKENNIIYNDSVIETIDINKIKSLINKYLDSKFLISNKNILDGYICSYYLKNKDNEIDVTLCNNVNVNLKNLTPI